MSEPETALLEGAVHPREQRRLFGHAAQMSFLAESYAAGTLHHALLVEGPEGVGKATLAFRFARHILNHPDPAKAPAHLDDYEPESAVERTIAAGASHNLLHLVRPNDERTGRLKQAITVDEVRKVGKFFGQTSGNGNWRIVIVDTADDLQKAGANAILKLLEEPPSRAMFFVLSNNPGRLLPTIRSRCMPVVLRPLDRPSLESALDQLGIRLDPRIRDRVLDAADGSVARALKLVNHGGLDIVEAFDAMLMAQGAARRREMHRLADALTGRDKDVAYDFFAEHLSEHVRIEARAAALAGETLRADRLSRLSGSVAERLALADGYNLDRKQTILSLLGDLSESAAVSPKSA